MRAVARIDLDAVRANLARIRDLAGSADVMAVVKADAYGHGMLDIARVARDEGVTWLGVALPSEALALRSAGDSGRILAWLWTPGDPDLDACLRADIDISVSSTGSLAEVVAASRRTTTKARVHVKVDTGLTRNGVPFEDLPAVLAACVTAMNDGDIDVVGMWSHLADGDTPGADSVREQRSRFDRALELAAAAGVHPVVRHLSNSGAVFAHPDCRYDLVRTGIAMYGLTPSPVLGAAAELGLAPAMSLVAELAHVKEIEAGTSVSYGWRWTSPSATRVGLVPVGYADGIPRAAGAPRLGTSVEVAVLGRRAPIVGTVAMDQFVVDLGVDSDAEPGTEVVLFGPGRQGEATADAWAETIGTIGYEVVTRVGPRVPRVYLGRRDDREGGT